MIETSFIQYTDGYAKLEAFCAFPNDGKKYPLVILCHAWGGRDSFICDKTKEIAELGYVGFALDMYGKGILGKSKQENTALKRIFLDDRAFLQRRLLKGYDIASSQPQVNKNYTAALGFGFGGLCALDLARAGVNLNSVISIYGHYDAPKNITTHPIKAKILVLHGATDPISTIEELFTFQEELNQAGVEWQTHIYGNTMHAFMNPVVNDPTAGLQYNSLSARRAWQSTEDFIKNEI